MCLQTLTRSRLQDVTPAEQVQQDPLCDRTVVLYGFARGRNLTLGTRMHLAGVGDFSVRLSSAVAVDQQYMMLCVQPLALAHGTDPAQSYRALPI